MINTTPFPGISQSKLPKNLTKNIGSLACLWREPYFWEKKIFSY